MTESRVISDLITGSVGKASAPVRFLYDPSDPYAVALDCTDLGAVAEHPSDGPVIWTFARQILVPGNLPDEDSAEKQDVRAHRDGAYLVLRLSSPDGSGTLRFPAQAVARFVHRTQALVPLGRESEHLDVDGAIRRLLDGAAW